MKPKSISGIVLRVCSLSLTREFYESLGFTESVSTSSSVTFRVNWFWIEFQEDPDMKVITSQLSSLVINVENLEEFYQIVLDLGYHPESAPSTHDNRMAFTLRDPNGHLLTFYQK